MLTVNFRIWTAKTKWKHGVHTTLGSDGPVTRAGVLTIALKKGGQEVYERRELPLTSGGSVHDAMAGT